MLTAFDERNTAVKVTPIIETERLVLRPFRRRDAAAASYNSRQPSVAHFMSDMVLPTKKDAKRWIRWIYRKVTVSGVLAVTLKSSNNSYHVVYQVNNGSWAGKHGTGSDSINYTGTPNPSTYEEMWKVRQLGIVVREYPPSTGTIYFAVQA